MRFNTMWKSIGILFLAIVLMLPNSAWAQDSTTTIELRETKETPTASGLLHVDQGRMSWGQPGRISPILHPGTPESAGMKREPIQAIDPYMEEVVQSGQSPGAVVLVARRGHVVKIDSYGDALRYRDDTGTPVDDPIPMRTNTIFDVASISKIFTTVAVMKLFEEGKFDLDDPVAKHLPEFAQNGKEKVTIRQLMTHTSGYAASIPLHRQGTDREDRIQIVLTHPLLHEPGTTYIYSDLNMIALGALVERLSGQRLDVFVRERITEPLGMKDTMYNPPASLKPRIAATEYQRDVDRGMVWGEVHDEKAWSLDGVAGHAGVFSSAYDLAIFAHTLLQKGKYGNVRILEEETVEQMEENQNEAFPGDEHGLGWELAQGWFMDALADIRTMGHTGFTGTSLVLNRDQATIAITLTNRVHPTRNTPTINPIRRQVARYAADAIPVQMPTTGAAWFAGYGDNLDRTLEAGYLPQAEAARTLTFDTWHRLEPVVDYGVVEGSSDGREWVSLTRTFTGYRDWQRVRVEIPVDIRYLRFRYHTDDTVNGRGWYVKEPVLRDNEGRTIKLKWKSEDGWEQREW
ncbi:serine hydrolase domain-containing protein [Desmospora activa]|uniref:CubicO group peptidase (Beta-lactamase class C family) n=1 Tax=Desmospora activa DSM 45169 TaxID=1121389 RepID=A0A2T4ZCG8_9BACL|nr:serine hydrolase domain-containing protein [Desmospora activa]PTM59562.1 CubicO group peptidase (beta-lactamase class C family) [Desmospora activa DSM 45169]